MKKSFGILLSAALLLTLCVSGNLAVSAADAEKSAETETQEITSETDASEDEKIEDDVISEETEESDKKESDKDTPDSERDSKNGKSVDGKNDTESDNETTDIENPGEENTDAKDTDTENTDTENADDASDVVTGTGKDEQENDKTAGSEGSDSETEEEKSSAKKEETQAAHIETCSDDCEDEECLCPCHLFDRLMACETLEELYALAEEIPEEQLLELTEEQNAKIEEKIAELEPEPLPEVKIPESTDKPVLSEIVYPTVNFDNVAPFGAPVEG